MLNEGSIISFFVSMGVYTYMVNNGSGMFVAGVVAVCAGVVLGLIVNVMVS